MDHPIGNINLECPPSTVEEHHPIGDIWSIFHPQYRKIIPIVWSSEGDNSWSDAYWSLEFRIMSIGHQRMGPRFFSGWCILGNRYMESCLFRLVICLAFICVVCHGECVHLCFWVCIHVSHTYWCFIGITKPIPSPHPPFTTMCDFDPIGIVDHDWIELSTFSMLRSLWAMKFNMISWDLSASPRAQLYQVAILCVLHHMLAKQGDERIRY